MPTNEQLDTGRRPENLTEFAGKWRERELDEDRDAAREHRIAHGIREPPMTDEQFEAFFNQLLATLKSIRKRDVRDFLASHNNPPVPLTPGITQVCKVLRSETLGIFYGSNVFEVHNGPLKESNDMEHWLRNLPLAGFDALNRITITCEFRGLANLALQVSLDLKSGMMRPLPSHKHPSDFVHSLMLFRAGGAGDTWPAGSMSTSGNDERLAYITVPAAALSKKHEDAKRLHGLGD